MLLMINDFVQNLVQLSLIIHLCIHILGNHIHLVLLVQSVSKLNIIFVSAKQRVIMHTANQLTFGTYGPFYNLTMPLSFVPKLKSVWHSSTYQWHLFHQPQVAREENSPHNPCRWECGPLLVQYTRIINKVINIF
jgi:hypothetical protein